MGDIKIKVTEITIPNNFKILYKAGITPYPFNGVTWTLYTGVTGNTEYIGGTETIDMIGNFDYDEQYWIKAEEVSYPGRWMIKNILINNEIAYQSVIP